MDESDAQSVLHELQRQHVNGYQLNAMTFVTVAYYGHLDVLRWLKENGCPWDENACMSAAARGNLAALQWLRENGCPWDNKTCHAAIIGGHLAVLQWAREHGCPLNNGWPFALDNPCYHAAKAGHLEVLQWLREREGGLLDERTCVAAVSIGRLDIIKWIRENGCPWSEWTSTVAAMSGNIEILTWLRENGCPWDPAKCAAEAGSNGYLDMLKWIRAEHRRGDGDCTPWKLTKCVAAAATKGHLDVLRWIYTECRGEFPGQMVGCWGVHENCLEFWDTYIVPFCTHGVYTPVSDAPKPALTGKGQKEEEKGPRLLL